MNDRTSKYDFVLVGGGLQAGLLTLAINFYQPNAKVLILESNDRLFGNHTWSFHHGDITQEWNWLAGLSMCQWPAYTVHFPGFERRVDLAYCSVSSEQFASAIESLASRGGNLEIRTGLRASSIGDNRVLTSSGDEFEGLTVIDCRGNVSSGISGVGFQKFYGLEIVLDEDWPDQLPVLMEANVDQAEGYRFLYALPFDRRRVLIEDTHFSESNTLDKADSLKQISAYLQRKSIASWRVLREEEGCLPMPFTSALTPTESDRLSGGYAGGWFHAATGYSFALAARFADVVASTTPEYARREVNRLAKAYRFQMRFSRILNRLLFRLVSPNTRFQIFRRFYRTLPNTTIQRFYAHEFTKTDAARILLGSPPSGLTPIRFLQSFKEMTCPV